MFKKSNSDPSYFYRLITYLRSPLLSKIASSGCYQTKDLWVSIQRQNEIRDEILEAWSQQDLDVIIGPGFPMLAPQHHLPSKLIAASAVTGVYNALDFPAGTLPVTRKTELDQVGQTLFLAIDITF